MSDPKEYIKNRKELVVEMEDKYGYIFCQACMVNNAYKFHCHHIMSRGRYPNHPMLHEKVNLIIICDKCHDKCHKEPEFNAQFIEQRNLMQLFFKKTK